MSRILKKFVKDFLKLRFLSDGKKREKNGKTDLERLSFNISLTINDPIIVEIKDNRVIDGSSQKTPRSDYLLAEEPPESITSELFDDIPIPEIPVGEESGEDNSGT